MKDTNLWRVTKLQQVYRQMEGLEPWGFSKDLGCCA